MIYGQSIKLEGVSFANAALPVLRDFKTLIAEHPNCIGAWRMDGADALSINLDGGIQSFGNWKTGGRPLVLASGQPATLIDNVMSGGKVARFAAGCVYQLDGYAWNLAKSYTMVAVFKPDSFATLNRVCGDFNPADMTKTAAIFSRKQGASDAMAMFDANNTLYQNVATGGSLLPVLARHDATAKVNYLTVVGTGSASGASAGAGVGISTFKVSDQTLYPFIGVLDFVALFDINTATDTALQVALGDYLAIRARAA